MIKKLVFPTILIGMVAFFVTIRMSGQTNSAYCENGEQIVEINSEVIIEAEKDIYYLLSIQQADTLFLYVGEEQDAIGGYLAEGYISATNDSFACVPFEYLLEEIGNLLDFWYTQQGYETEVIQPTETSVPDVTSPDTIEIRPLYEGGPYRFCTGEYFSVEEGHGSVFVFRQVGDTEEVQQLQYINGQESIIYTLEGDFDSNLVILNNRVSHTDHCTGELQLLIDIVEPN